jgi:hypothetical protein
MNVLGVASFAKNRPAYSSVAIAAPIVCRATAIGLSPRSPAVTSPRTWITCSGWITASSPEASRVP